MLHSRVPQLQIRIQISCLELCSAVPQRTKTWCDGRPPSRSAPVGVEKRRVNAAGTPLAPQGVYKADLPPTFSYARSDKLRYYRHLLPKTRTLLNMTRISLEEFRPLSFLEKISGCISRFEGIRFNDPFNGNFERRQLQLDIAKVRLCRLGKAIDRDRENDSVDESGRISQEANATLDELLWAFEESRNKSKRHEERTKLGHKGRTELGTPLVLRDQVYKDLHDWLVKMTPRTPMSHSSTENQMWALYLDSDARRLRVEITDHLDDLEKLFPVDKILLELAQSAVDTLENQPDMLKLLAATAGDTDKVLFEAAMNKLGYLPGRNLVGEINRDDSASVHIGDTLTDDALRHAQRGRFEKTINSAGLITAKGASVVQVGNRYGEPSIFNN